MTSYNSTMLAGRDGACALVTEGERGPLSDEQTTQHAAAVALQPSSFNLNDVCVFIVQIEIAGDVVAEGSRVAVQ